VDRQHMDKGKADAI